MKMPHNQLILNTGEHHTGIIFVPFGTDVPSDYAEPAASQRASAHRSPIGGGGEGWTTRPDAGGTSLEKPSAPIGEPWVLLVLAALYGCWKMIARRRAARKAICVLLALSMSICAPVRAGITSLSISPSDVVNGGDEMVITPVIASVPDGTVFVCWGLFYDAACENEVSGIDFHFSPSDGKNAVTCNAPVEAGTYYLKSSLHTGYICGGSMDSYYVTPVEVYPEGADIVLTRNAQEAATYVAMTSAAEKRAYGALRFSKNVLNDDDLSPYERYNYFISFPFDVKVEDIYGIGQVGTHWLLYYYDGKGRAEEGFFADRTDNWAMIDDTDSVLHAGQGYLLQLNSIQMDGDNEAVWRNGSETATLFFPALSTFTGVTVGNETIPALGEAYRCTIDLSASLGSEGDRRNKDSFWRCIGTPGFDSPSGVSGMEYLYEWNPEDNSLTVVSAAGFAFLPTHAYLVQYGGEIIWSGVTKPSGIVARQEEEAFYEWRMELRQGERVCDQTFVRMSGDASTDFEFGRDLMKEMNSGKANIYTLAGYERLAANCLPESGQTTMVPVGVTIASDGEYTFAMPEGTNGVGVTLIDNGTGARTSLSALDYTVNLTAGTHDGRFVLEISPVHGSTTGMETVGGEPAEESGARKMIIDQKLFIIKGDKMYDARGAMVK